MIKFVGKVMENNTITEPDLAPLQIDFDKAVVFSTGLRADGASVTKTMADKFGLQAGQKVEGTVKDASSFGGITMVESITKNYQVFPAPFNIIPKS